MQGPSRNTLEILGCLTSGRRREDGDQVPPRRSPPDGHGCRGIGDEKEACQAEYASYETENHWAEGSEA